jgi:hypothetical protein
VILVLEVPDRFFELALAGLSLRVRFLQDGESVINVIFLTQADCAQILHAGFKACLPKPFTPDTLLEDHCGCA